MTLWVLSSRISRARLDALDPATVAREAVTLVAEHVGRLGLYLSPGAEIHADLREPLATSLGQLAAYAQSGSLGDWPDHSCAIGCLQTVCECLYSQAGVPGTFGGGALDAIDDEADPDEPIGVVILAAHGRYQLAGGHPIPLRELAALASCGARRLRQLVEAGEIRARDGSVRAPDARRWLAARGVPGYRAAA